ncbi:hypothetical protein B0H65DRAFT_456397 [Neurospora tetraspora]|uniref:Uncharacterized protein n=1 Tax=Neurospora tetraspora TaxID=94610 RepID=A0AAE0JJQ2_9PEZI|nr:hypothetical protein B0H65DRAFT_456397 [Neurospora tetraspora]
MALVDPRETRFTGLETWDGRLAGLQCHIRWVRAIRHPQRSRRDGHKEALGIPAGLSRNYAPRNVEGAIHILKTEQMPQHSSRVREAVGMGRQDVLNRGSVFSREMKVGV